MNGFTADGFTGFNIDETFTPTPSDTVDIVADAANTRARKFVWFFCTATGTLRINDISGVTRNFTGLAANTMFPIPLTRLHSTGTSATGFVVFPG